MHVTAKPPTGIEVGDVVTISGFFDLKENPDRRWWQFWKPRHVPGAGHLTKFHVVKVFS